MKRVLMFGLLGLMSVARAEYSVGAIPPDFTCTDWNGNTWNLEENRGKVVLLNFGATWCGPCNEEMPELQANFFEYYDPAGFSIVHIDTDGITAQALHNHWDALGVTFPVLVGCDNLYSDYGDGYIPYNCLLNSEGEILYASSGYNPGTLHSLIEANIHVDRPVLSVQSVAVNDNGNGDGRPDAGEVVTLTPTFNISNIGEATTGGSVTLSSTDPAISIEQGTISFAAGTPGGSVVGQSGFVINVVEGIEPHWATLTFHYTANHANGTAQGDLTYEQRMGRPSLLVVDSDGAMDDNESFVQTALSALQIDSDVWTATGTLTSTEMGHYSRVIWLGGKNQTDMSDDEELAVRDFVTAGGQLLISSQYLSDNADRHDLMLDVFGVTLVDDDGGNIFLLACPQEDPYFSGSSMVVTGAQAANNNEDPDVLAANGSTAVFATWNQNAAMDQPAAVYTTAPGVKAMFCGFPIEANKIHSQSPGSMTVQGFLERAFNYFEGVVGVEPVPVVASSFRIVDAQPNPFNPTTRLTYELSTAGTVSIALFNVMGQEVRTFELGSRPVGAHSVTVDGAGLASGLYVARLTVDGQARDTHKLMMVK